MGTAGESGLRRLAVLRRQLEDVQGKKDRLLTDRNALLARLADSGVSRTELAQACGLTPGRITQLLDRGSAVATSSEISEVRQAL